MRHELHLALTLQLRSACYYFISTTDTNAVSGQCNTATALGERAHGLFASVTGLRCMHHAKLVSNVHTGLF